MHSVQDGHLLRRVLVAAVAAAAMCSAALAAEPKTLEQRLQAIEDRHAIEQLMMRYANALNSRDADAYVETFAPDGSLELRLHEGAKPIGPFKGREALRRQWFPDADEPAAPGQGGLTADGRREYGPMRHVTTNYVIDVNGDRARLTAYFIEVVSTGLNSPPGSRPPALWAMGRYDDELVKLDGRWYFSKRVVVTDMNTRFEPDPPR